MQTMDREPLQYQPLASPPKILARDRFAFRIASVGLVITVFSAIGLFSVLFVPDGMGFLKTLLFFSSIAGLFALGPALCLIGLVLCLIANPFRSGVACVGLLMSALGLSALCFFHLGPKPDSFLTYNCFTICLWP
jgi:hypothetical protein